MNDPIIKIKLTLKEIMDRSGLDSAILNHLDNPNKLDYVLNFLKFNFNFTEIDDGR